MRSAGLICPHLGTLSLFCDQEIWRKVESVLMDSQHALYVEFERLPVGTGADH